LLSAIVVFYYNGQGATQSVVSEADLSC
jgi:hypothetical protein